MLMPSCFKGSVSPLIPARIFFKGCVGVQVIEGRDVSGQAGQGNGHLLGLAGRQTGGFEHSAHGAGVLLCGQLGQTEGRRRGLGEFLDLGRAAAEGHINDVLDLFNV